MHNKVRYHSTGFVLSEIEHILSTNGRMDYLYFLDTMFLSNWERVNNLCRELIKNGLSKRLKWAATVTADAVDDEKVSLMKEAGCFYLSFGFESNSSRALKIMNKRATPKDNEKACEACEKHGIYINSAFLFGIPGEEEEDLQQTIDFVKRHNIGFTGINIMKPLPGSPFYERFVKQGIILPSIEEWHRISSIYQMGRIFNDRLSSDQYSKYIEKFYDNARLKSLCNSLRANWRKNLKYLFASTGK
jgi:anaerobic magnesium-protoporphyrin IX monomethyl ester cyclase